MNSHLYWANTIFRFLTFGLRLLTTVGTVVRMAPAPEMATGSEGSIGSSESGGNRKEYPVG